MARIWWLLLVEGERLGTMDIGVQNLASLGLGIEPVLWQCLLDS